MDTELGPSAKDAILDSAEDLFARQGFDATTIKELAAAAQVNGALLYYYFGDKEKLYHAVLQRRVEAFVSEGVKALSSASGPNEGVAALIAFQARMLRDHPALPRLLMRELLDHDAAHAKAQITHVAANMFRRLCELIEEGQRVGTFRPDLDPRFAAISSIAQVIYFHVAQPAVRILLAAGAEGEPPVADRDAFLAAFAEHASRFALSALAARPEKSPGAGLPRGQSARTSVPIPNPNRAPRPASPQTQADGAPSDDSDPLHESSI